MVPGALCRCHRDGPCSKLLPQVHAGQRKTLGAGQNTTHALPFMIPASRILYEQLVQFAEGQRDDDDAGDASVFT